MDDEDLIELKEFNFPADDKRVQEFGKLGQKSQLEVLELGCLMRNIGMDKTKRMVNGENAIERDNLSKMYNKQIENLEERNKEMERKNMKLQQTYSSEIQSMKRDIKEQTRQIYEDRLKASEKRFNESEKKNHLLISERLSAQSEFHKQLSIQKEKDDRQTNEMRKNYEKKLDEYREKLETFNQIKNNSAKKGQEGENWIYNQLLRSFPTHDIIDHHTKGHTGDFSIIDETRTGMVESKNYARNVNKKEVEKFYKDIEYNNDINYGILVSLKSGVVSRNDFCLEFCGGKPIIFLNFVKNEPYKIKIAYDMCQLILKNQDCFDVKKEEDQCRLKAFIKTMSARNTKLHSTLNNFSTEMNKQLDEQWSQFESLIRLLNIEH